MNLALKRSAPFVAELLPPAAAGSRSGSPALPGGAVTCNAEDAFLRLPKHTMTATVGCLSGCLWITLDIEPADVLIAAGESSLSISETARWPYGGRAWSCRELHAAKGEGQRRHA